MDNLFINEYLPYATPNQLKVYLYGLYMCSVPDGKDNSVEGMSSVLGISEDEIMDIFAYWADNGLLQIITKNPLEIKYLSLKGAKQPPKKYKSEKYYDFNLQVNELFPNRPLISNEYLLLYEAMDLTKIQPDAMLMIIQYCIRMKGQSVHFPYIVAVAKNWASEGIRTADDVEEKLGEYEAQDENMRAVLKALGRKSGSGDFEEKQTLLKWQKSWGFDMDSIICAAKQCKNKGGFKRLDSLLDEYYRMNIHSRTEMEEYVAHRERMRSLAIKINTTIGVFYESVDHEIETYIGPWLGYGFDEAALGMIAHYCFLAGIRTLKGVDSYVQKFYKLGILTTEGINEYIEHQIQADKVIQSVLEATGTHRSVTQSDRDFYKVWCIDWGFSDDMIMLAARMSLNSRFPTAAINKQLAYWKENKISSPEAAEQKPVGTQTQSPQAPYVGRDYTKEQLKATFSDLDNFSGIDL